MLTVRHLKLTLGLISYHNAQLALAASSLFCLFLLILSFRTTFGELEQTGLWLEAFQTDGTTQMSYN